MDLQLFYRWQLRLHYFRKRDIVSVTLDTDDFRLPAIKNYLNLGFVPDYLRENHVLRWENIFEKLGLLEK